MIKQKRLESNGNYDAMFAKVSNFHWSFLPDGSYYITLDLVIIGDIVESFKINVLTNGPVIENIETKDQPKDKSEFSSSQIIDLYANQSSIGQYFYNLKTEAYGEIKQRSADKSKIENIVDAAGIIIDVLF